MLSVLKILWQNTKRVIRVRLRTNTTIVLVIIFSLIATILLISLLPTGVDNKISPQRETQNRAQRVAEFAAERHQIASPEAQAQHSKRRNFKYGDEYAHFDDSTLGNYESRKESHHNRNGDDGRPYKPHFNENETSNAQSLKSQYGMNIAVSQLIPMDRTVPDIRLDECKYWNYADKLPTASVVVVFHNEGLSTLMRTVHSIILGSPRKLLREVLLVDDFSDKEPLKDELEKYIHDNFGDFKDAFNVNSHDDEYGRQGEELHENSGKVRLIRNKERQGLIRSRSRGAIEALGEVIVFLDAHCEVNYNWLPPLLAPIAKNRKTLTVPVIDGIDSETFHYRPVYARPDQHYQGIWEWGMYYKEIELDMKEHLKTHKVSEPYEAPTHAGGLFAIDKQYFLDLGTYDSGLLVWGGENFELSFKVWQCGGELLWVPCSRVGHVYRPFMPYTFGSLASKRKGPLIITNYKRVIEVWWDKEFKDYFYTREPLATYYDQGNITAQLDIKKRLGCKSFTWFMNRIGKVVYKHFPQLPPNVAWGEVRSVRNSQCLDSVSSSPPQTIRMSACHSYGGNQLFRLNEKGQLGVGERCVDSNGRKMTLVYCKLGAVEGPWRYDADTQQLIHETSGKCVEGGERGNVFIKDCEENTRQQWVFKTIKPRGF